LGTPRSQGITPHGKALVNCRLFVCLFFFFKLIFLKKENEYTKSSFSCSGEFSPNFDLKNMISTYTKDFSWKNLTQILQILKRKFLKTQIVLFS